jgi:hypothetical protein
VEENSPPPEGWLSKEHSRTLAQTMVVSRDRRSCRVPVLDGFALIAVGLLLAFLVRGFFAHLGFDNS